MKNNRFKIGKKKIGEGNPVFIIAEAGVNHNGRFDLALKMVDAAAAAGADAVKFQTFRAEDVVVGKAPKAPYQKNQTGRRGSQQEMLKKLELPEKFYQSLLQRCREKKIIFLSTPHGGKSSVDFLASIKAPAFKFGSGDITNLPLLSHAASFGKPMILGTGASYMAEVREAVRAIRKAGNEKIIVLHCTSSYPCPLKEVNLAAMREMRKKLGVLTGYSDHTEGLEVPVLAAAWGASVLEKHFTLDSRLSGPDHRVSLDTGKLKEMVRRVRNISVITGKKEKVPVPSERSAREIIRKSIVVARTIKKGEVLTEENLCLKRPGTGLSPKFFKKFLGKKARINIAADTLLASKHYG